MTIRFGFSAGAAAVAGLLASGVWAKEFKAADTHPIDYPTVQAVIHMGKLIEQRSGGKHTFKMFPSSQLGQEKDTIEQTKFGAIDINRVNLAPFNNIVPESALPGLPFLFRSVEHMHKVMDSAIGEEILKAFEPHGFVGLAYYDSGARSFYNSKRPIQSPADMKGMKIRVQQSDMFVAIMQALGANATPMAFGEVYTALKTGVIDGAENNWPSYESTRHFEVAKHYTLNEHSMSPEVLVMSKRSWDGLTADERKMFHDAAKESVAVMRKLWFEREKKSEAMVRQAGSMIVDKVDKRPFIDAMKPVYDRFVTDAKMKTLVARIQAVQ